MMNNSQMEDEDFPPLPPPLSPGQGGQDHGNLFTDGDEGEVSKLADVPAAKRRGVKRPQPKLDSQRLTSERGLPALRTLFENVRFKGKGHEAEDLQLLMQKMENWAHRLYPKLQFEDFISKVEKLGGKKDVQTCLKRIRLDMPLTHDDFMVTEGDEEAEPEAFREPDPFGDLQGPVHSTPAPPAPPAPPHHSPAAPSLTEEQRLRMELNRQRALERRLARQRQETDSQTVLTSSIQNESSSSTDVLNVSGDQEGTVETNGGSSCTQPLSQRPPTDPEPLSEPTERAQTASDPEPTERDQTASDPEPTERAQTASDPEPTERAQTASDSEPTERAQTASKPTEDIQNVHNSEPTEHAQTDLEPTEHAQTDLEPTEHAQTIIEDGD
ncbi:TIMELESS-interacting protein [Mugil cephalus]|uniref:TIMELESS-interacting protein n=1 Tax=Mugil cephalus TaxID=48193 RepID=UPI001FB79CDE|nr:TIMELESS-interacting protein [Mugil cephalus]XP_047436381.1 TIMELESS-interacting protein [Mugil cephalus]